MNIPLQRLLPAITGMCLVFPCLLNADSHSPAAVPPGPEELRAARPKQSPPPIPLSTEREKRILQAVFARFPDVEPAAVMDYLRDHFPQEVRYFTELSVRDVERSVEYLTRVVGDCAQLLRTKESDPGRYAKLLALQKGELEAYGQADAYNASAADARDAHKQGLITTLDDCFEIKQDLMRKELADLEQELMNLREMIEKREKSKDAIINRRFLQITGENDGLGW